MTADRIGRAQVMRRLLAHYEDPRYLEIGVCEGRTFDRVDAAVRVAVDPEFRFDHTAAERRVPGTTYHQVTSDEFFGTLVEPAAQDRDDEKAWMGDVYRLVYFIETFCQQLSFRVIANNHGQAVVWRRRRAEVPQRGLADVGAMTFEQMMLDEAALRLAPFGEIVRELRADLGLTRPDP